MKSSFERGYRMLESTVTSAFDFSIVCQAEVDLPSWLQELTGHAGWQLLDQDESELCEVYSYRRGSDEAEVALYHTGYATVDVGGKTLYDGHLGFAPGFARLQYYNAESGEKVSVN
jgi:hypothetical protein